MDLIINLPSINIAPLLQETARKLSDNYELEEDSYTEGDAPSEQERLLDNTGEIIEHTTEASNVHAFGGIDSIAQDRDEIDAPHLVSL